jgi:aspartate oxidase
MFDLVVVGSGAAGLSAALRATDLGASVGVLTGGQLLAGSSPRAQGGVAAALNDAPTAAPEWNTRPLTLTSAASDTSQTTSPARSARSTRRTRRTRRDLYELEFPEFLASLSSERSERADGVGRRAMDPRARGARVDADLGVERDALRLERLVTDLPEPENATRTDLLLASLIARAALLRAESRGAHFRTDAPEPDPVWRGRIHWRLAHPPAFEEVLTA